MGVRRVGLHRRCLAARVQQRAPRRTPAEAGDASRTGQAGEDDEWLAELGQFIVSEDCPRCGKVFTEKHAAHLRVCKGVGGAGAMSKVGGTRVT